MWMRSSFWAITLEIELFPVDENPSIAITGFLFMLQISLKFFEFENNQKKNLFVVAEFMED